MALLMDVAEDTREYVWPGFVLDRDLTFWIGEEKAGKGMLWVKGAANITRGLPMPPVDQNDPRVNWDDVPGPAYVIAIGLEDDTAMDLVPRARAAGADLELFDDFSHVERKDNQGGAYEDRFDIVTDLGALADRIDELNQMAMDRTRNGIPTGGVRLVIIDPLMDASSRTVSFNQQVRRHVIRPLQQLARNKGVAILLIGHFTKGASKAIDAGKPVSDYIGGSKGIIDACRLNCLLLKDRASGGKVRRLSVLSANGGATSDVIEFMVIAEGPNDPNAHLRFAMPKPEKMDKAAWDAQARYILDQLIALKQPADDRELATLLGLSHAIVRQAMMRNQKAGDVAMVRGKWQPRAAIEGRRQEELPGPRDWSPGPQLQSDPGTPGFTVPKGPLFRKPRSVPSPSFRAPTSAGRRRQ